MWATPAWMATLGAWGQLFSCSHPTKRELAAARAVSVTRAPAGKTALEHRPVVPVRVNVQSMPAGDDLTRPSPVKQRDRDRVPLFAWNWVVTVMVAPRRAPPASPTIVEEVGLVTGF